MRLPKSVWVGNPVRPEIEQLPRPQERWPIAKRRPLRLLVLGGSLGAAAINEMVPKGLALMRRRGAAGGRASGRREAPGATAAELRAKPACAPIAWLSSRTWRAPTNGPIW
jgi:UDP-N-acetylglucosamine--N-acetylmuramyl-(pentapeptide) pyrophosphoryl-undecaprenol N-acetylglucosamine transferase